MDSVLKAALWLQFFQSSLGLVFQLFLQKGLQKLFPWVLETENPLPFYWNGSEGWKILKLPLTPLKPLCCHRLPSRVDFSFRIYLIGIHFLLTLYFNLYIYDLFQKSFLNDLWTWLHLLLVLGLLQRHLLHISWLSLVFLSYHFFV